MITKDGFCRILENVKNIEKKFKHLEDFIGQPICECDFYDYTSSILAAIAEDMKMKICEELIFDFAYTHNWGEEGKVSLNLDGVDKTVSNFEELYDLLEDLTEDL